MVPITAQDSAELLASLADIDISVPLRTEGRTTEHCERWSICRFLAAFANSGLFDYPLKVDHEDKPDFILNQSNIQLGIEVTEVVSSNAAAIEALREHQEMEGMYFLQRHHPDDTRLKGKQLSAKALSDEPGDGWAGDSVEREWVAAMQARIHEKVGTSSKEGFRLFQRNWLLMYDGWQLPGVNREKAAKMLCHSTNNEDYGQFELVFIESSSRIWVFGPSHLSSMPINELWETS